MAATSSFHHIVRFRYLGIGFSLVWLFFVFSGSVASANTSPPVAINEATAFRNIVEDGDLLIIHRYELPVSDVALTVDAWCAYLSNTTYCDSDPVNPDEPTSLINSRAFTSVYTSFLGTPYSGTLEYQVNLPRIDHGLHFAYFTPGHTITWADSSTVVCVESSQDFFTTAAAQSCIEPIWNSAASDTASQRAIFGTALTSMISNLEAAHEWPINFLYDSIAGITTSGAFYAREAFPLAVLLAPGEFQSSSSAAIAGDFVPSGNESALQQAIDADSSSLNESLAWFSTNVFNQTAGMMVTLAFGGLGLLVGSALQAATNKTELFWFGFITITMAGAALRGPTISTMFAAALVVSSVAAWYVIRRVPA